MDDKYQKRVLQNREAQRNFRERKKKQTQELLDRISELEKQLIPVQEYQKQLADAQHQITTLLIEKDLWRQEKLLLLKERQEMVQLMSTSISMKKTHRPLMDKNLDILATSIQGKTEDWEKLIPPEPPQIPAIPEDFFEDPYFNSLYK